jgi:hypothetical protein
MRIFSLLLFMVLLSKAYASFERQGIGASNVGLSLSGIASRSPDFSTLTNPALISGTPIVDLFYRNHFGLKELNQIALCSEFTILEQSLGLGIMRYGNTLYSETELSLATSIQLDSTLYFGLNINNYFLQIENYGNANTFGFGISMFYQLNKQLRIAGIANNINEPEIGSSNEKISVSGILGLSYSPITEVEILMDSYKEEYHDFAYRIGARIEILSGINLLAGFQHNINSFSLGLEFNQNSYAIKYSVDIHPVLNLSHAIGFRYVL